MSAKMIPVILNTDFERLALVDDFISFIWTSRYYESGDFELVVPVTDRNIDLIKKDYYVGRDDDENLGIIEDIVIQRDEVGSERMIASGRFLQSILGRRIIAEQTTVSGKVSDCLELLVDDALVNPSDLARTVENFRISHTETSNTMQAQYTGKNLLEVVTDVCKTYGLGFKVTPDAQNRFFFKIYEGIDRTYDQDENDWVIFSDKYDNLLSSDYEECYRNQVTAVLVAGEGEGLDRKTAWASDGTEGLLRREVYKDQRNLQSNEGEIPEDEYEEILKESGRESLTQVTTAFTGQVYFDQIEYKKDVFLGDLCVIENSRWRMSINARLVEVIESISETGAYSITPTFGA